MHRVEFTETFEAFLSSPSSNERALVGARGFEPLTSSASRKAGASSDQRFRCSAHFPTASGVPFGSAWFDRLLDLVLTESQTAER
jgi:hypothetical protein